MESFELEIKKAQLNRIDAIQKAFTSSDEDILEKGKSATIGEIRTWGDKKYRKQPNGKWVEVSEKGVSAKEHLKYAKKHKLIADKETSNTVANSYYESSGRHYDAAEKLSDKEYDESELSGGEKTNDSGIGIEEKDGNTLLKKNGKVYGYVKKSNDGGYSYNIGKPTDRQVSTFTGNKEPLTKEQAIERLKNSIK
jgi:hypothetical protein